MRYYKPFFYLLFLLPFSSSAQGYLPGYIVSNSGDTLKGYIKYIRSEYSPRVIKFKPDAYGKISKYSASNTKFFSINIGYPLNFQRYSGRISMDDINVNNLTTLCDTGFKIDTVFLRILRKGKNITLYSYDDALKTRFFVSDGESLPLELVYRIYLKTDIHDRHNTVDENIYKMQLIALARKYGKMNDDLQKDFENSNYAEANLEDITDKINGYTGPDITKGNYLGSPPKAKLAIMLAAFAGVVYLVLSVMNK